MQTLKNDVIVNKIKRKTLELSMLQSEEEEGKWRGDNVVERIWAQLTVRQQLDNNTDKALPLALKVR